MGIILKPFLEKKPCTIVHSFLGTGSRLCGVQDKNFDGAPTGTGTGHIVHVGYTKIQVLHVHVQVQVKSAQTFYCHSIEY